MTTIVKRNRAIEDFATHKLLASIEAACLSVRTPAGEAVQTAEQVLRHILPWLETKIEVTSADLRRQVEQHLPTYNPDAAYIYSRERMLS